MTRQMILFLSAVCIISTCGNDNSATDETIILENVLSLELSFGDKDLPDKYLFARPRGSNFCIDNQGNIYVAEEKCVKVYDSNGKPVKIIGSPGQGPGEFENANNPNITETGFLTVRNNWPRTNLYGPNHEFLKFIVTEYMDYYQEYKELKGRLGITKIYSYGLDKRLFRFSGKSLENEEISTYGMMLDDGRTLRELVKYQVSDYCYVDEVYPAPGRAGMPKPYSGKFYYDILPDSRFVYTHSEIDRYEREGQHYYRIFIKSFATGDSIAIEAQYNPVKIDKEERDKKYPGNSESIMGKALYELAQDVKFHPPVQRILADGDFVFVYTFEHNEQGELRIDVFDVSAGRRVSSAYFPEKFDVIKDGFAYFMRTSRTEFYRLEKYRIDPAVYGK